MGNSNYDTVDLPTYYVLDIDNENNIVVGSLNGSLWKINYERQIIWQRDIEYEMGSQPPFNIYVNPDHFSVFIDINGNIIVIGYADLSAKKCNDGIFIRKYSAGGDLLWTTCFSEEDEIEGNRIGTIDPENNLLVLGKKNTTAENNGTSEWIIRKFDENGSIVKTQIFSDNFIGPNVILDLATDHDGFIYLTGEILSRDNELRYDIWVGKYDANMNEIWTFNYNNKENEDERGNMIILDKNNDVIIAGTLNTSLKVPIPPKRLWLGKLNQKY